MFKKHQERGIDLLTNPVLIVEVTSPESILRDRQSKKDSYLQIESLQDYLIVEPDSVQITHWKCVNDEWKKYVYDGLDDKIELASTDEVLSLSEIYRVVLFNRRRK